MFSVSLRPWYLSRKVSGHPAETNLSFGKDPVRRGFSPYRSLYLVVTRDIIGLTGAGHKPVAFVIRRGEESIGAFFGYASGKRSGTPGDRRVRYGRIGRALWNPVICF
ncbi:protein of unknown function [Kyrpidia spormannii]|uniref:Uncharacterized protein n=2 Tax=Kyrpidia spormannii TaxID=2055160 RepID=A0ACA8Z993_9BACL|nr:protein of unknown function [Kyrpidia spormannii]CAB3392771.1 protein of unknown function [Kyrpidia spormannii]